MEAAHVHMSTQCGQLGALGPVEQGSQLIPTDFQGPNSIRFALPRLQIFMKICGPQQEGNKVVLA